MPNYKPMPPLERLNELLKVVEIPLDKYGVWSGLVWQVRRNGTKGVGSVAGSLRLPSGKPGRMDWRIRVDGVYYYASRIVYYMTRGEDPGNIQVDHKDQNPLNNNEWNLRLDVDGDIQSVNQPMRRDNTSGMSGVSWHKRAGKWQAHVQIEGKTDHLGYFTCKIEAACAVRDKWIELGWNKLGRELPDLNEIKCSCCQNP